MQSYELMMEIKFCELKKIVRTFLSFNNWADVSSFSEKSLITFGALNTVHAWQAHRAWRTLIALQSWKSWFTLQS